MCKRRFIRARNRDHDLRGRHVEIRNQTVARRDAGDDHGIRTGEGSAFARAQTCNLIIGQAIFIGERMMHQRDHAIGHRVENGIIKCAKGQPVDQGGRITTADYRTTHPKYWAGGDAVNGGAEVVNAAAEGKARCIARAFFKSVQKYR